MIKYENWDKYVAHWRSNVGSPNLGDEWGMDRTFIEKLDVIKPGSSVLEIGSGGGRVTELILKKTKHVVVCDIADEMLKLISKRFPDVPTVKIDSFTWNFPDDSFDFVISFDCMVHIELADLFFYLGEIKRILKPNGQAILHIINVDSSVGFSEWVDQLKGHQLGSRPFYSFGAISHQIFDRICDYYKFEISSKQPISGNRDLLYMVRNSRNPPTRGGDCSSRC